MPTETNDSERLNKLADNMERIWSSSEKGGYRWPTRKGLVESGCFDCDPEDLRRWIDGL